MLGLSFHFYFLRTYFGEFFGEFLPEFDADFGFLPLLLRMHSLDYRECNNLWQNMIDRNIQFVH
jgi:hypothetical protein